MDVFKKYTPEELERQYNVRDSRTDYETVIVPDWTNRSAHTREHTNCTLDLQYGPFDKQKLDYFPAGDAGAPTLIFFHGGYWQRGDKSAYSFLAEPFVNNGINMIIAGYSLCPTVSMTDLTEQSRQVLVWLWENSDHLGINPNRIVVSGHSAGGHLTEMLMGTDWPRRNKDLPVDLIKAGVPISPLSLLEPIRHTTINDALGMDTDEAEMLSPMNTPPVTTAPQLIVCGGAETDEFHRQSDMYFEAFNTAEIPFERYNVPNADHFDEINILADANSEFFRKLETFVKSV
jgi:arylformamidase|tara:strand:- start:1886 stop:2752 length:867 start_codon:yes stop_codon:yes gene_type:complete